MSINKRIIKIALAFLLVSCKSDIPTEQLLRICHDDFVQSQVQLSDIADSVFFVQYDSEIVAKVRRNKHASQYIFVDSSDGILKYNRKGKFLQKIGSIGQGPAEYNQTYHFGLDELNEKVWLLLQ